ncbi:MAG: sialate O-acetylesterase [Candidatus Hydrogenedentes bacterium]|nr:sialate O-acetylesterase [Candidatus Hydrogenedentota bacterium]
MNKRVFTAALLLSLMLSLSTRAGLTVTKGLAAYQVLQCDENDTAQASCSGTWTQDGDMPVQGRLMQDNAVVLEWQDIGTTVSGTWQGVLEGIPVGGPYTIELRAGDDTCLINPVLAGDLWILAGQSNMQGVGNTIDMVPPNPSAHMLAMNGVWRTASDPLHILQESIDPVHYRPESEEEQRKAVEAARNWPKGAGLGMPFAIEMIQRTGRPVGLVCTAHGGTSMEQWNPDKKEMEGESLYGSMLAQVRRAGGKVHGVLWYQGESDANPDAAAVFPKKFETLVAAIRQDLHQPELPFYYVQIGRFTHPDPKPGPWNLIQTMQLAAEKSIPNSGMVASIDLALDDLIHIGTPGLKRLGVRLANLVAHDLYDGTVLAGPRPENASYIDTPYGKQIHVTFSGVNERLAAQGRPVGFSISSGSEGDTVPFLYKVELPEDAPDTAILWVHELPKNPQVWYGRGLDPCANITDEADMAVPVFGPLPVIK